MCLNNDSNDVFGMMLMYDKADSALRNRMRYDGKPSGVRWMTRNYHNTRTEERSYLYFYDGFNRYTAEGYAERDSAQVGNSAYSINRGAFNEIVSYDAGGNISKLSRYMTNPGGGSRQQIDTLTYTYSSTNPYQLQSVADGTDTWHTGYGYRNLTDSTGNYTYDGNGNLYNDHYKGMELRYNVLNRTDKITITTASSTHIDYTYDSDGNLIRKQEYNGSSTPATTTDYIDGFVYLTSGSGTAALSYFPMPEGRVLDSLNTFTQEFIITDPQGNARVAFRKVGTTTPRAKVWQENSYYGTGFILPNSPVSAPTIPNKRLYNGGSEWQNDYSNLPDYYQTFNRNYDAAIGRFISVDPAAESAGSLTSYQYAGNNPIISNDPAGDRFDPNPPPSYAGMSEFSQNTGGGFVFATEDDYDGLNGVLGWDALMFGGPTITVADDTPGPKNAASTSTPGDDGNEPLTTSGTYAVAAPSLLAQAREAATVIGGETIYRDYSGATMLQAVTVYGEPIDNPFQVIYYPTPYIEDGQQRYGASINLFYKGQGSGSYQFIQTVTQFPRHRTPGGMVLANPFLDTKFNGNIPINSPFYFTDDNNTLNTTYANGLGYQAYFWDLAGSSNPWTIFSAQVTIVINNGGQLTAGGSISWGYFEVNIPGFYVGSFITPYIYTPNPNDATQQAIQKFNSSH